LDIYTSIEGEKYIITIDKIKPTYHGDLHGVFFTNDEVVDEEKEYIQTYEEGCPFHFYSIDGELVLLYEMMLS
jgi:hypothetical protein